MLNRFEGFTFLFIGVVCFGSDDFGESKATNQAAPSQFLHKHRDITTLLEQVKSQDIEELKVGETQYDNIIDQVDELCELLEKISEKFSQESKSILGKIKKNLKKWSKDESKILEKIDEKKEELEEQGIEFDLAFIKQLAKDDAKYKKKLKKLNAKRDKYKKKLKNRDQLYENRKELRSDLYKKRYKWALKVNDLLEKTVVDFFIKIEFGKGHLSEATVELIKDKLNWYKTKKPRIRRLTRLKNPFELYEILDGKKKEELKNLKNNEGGQLFSDDECREIIEKLNKPEIKQRLQELKFNDFPKLHVTKVEEINGEKKYRKKDFTKLSLGQQQSILLSILLYSDNKYPLLIDQPEDNLDSEFIYKTIVSNLKRVKERRQVIIVTHNPNIAVLGDAELIIPLKSTSDKAHIIDRGSIDNAGTKDITCKILEGSKSAFRQRKEIYGL